MRTEQQQLHDAYDKHEIGQKLYRVPSNPYSNWPALTQCPCGDWLVYNASEKAWEPLFGHVAAAFINHNPDLYPVLKAWWPHRPCKGTPEIDWENVDFNVDMGIKAFYDRQAPVHAKPKGSQNDTLDNEQAGNILQQMLPNTPYTPPNDYGSGDYGLYKSVTISTTDNTAAQNIFGPGTPQAPKNIHNLWGILGVDDGDKLK